MSSPISAERPEQVPVERAYIALGANLGDARGTFEAAFEALDEMPATRLVARSSLYRTAPIGVSGQPDYINAVAALDTALSPEALLDALLALEARHGRTREYPLAARTLDLDLLLYGDRVLDLPSLQIPHPRMHLRAFVLMPLAEIAPALSLPGHGAVADLLRGVTAQQIERLSRD